MSYSSVHVQDMTWCILAHFDTLEVNNIQLRKLQARAQGFKFERSLSNLLD